MNGMVNLTCKPTRLHLPICETKVGWSQWAKHLRPKLKQRIFDSAVALFTEKVFYSESLLVSALNKIPSLVEIPNQPGRGV